MNIKKVQGIRVVIIDPTKQKPPLTKGDVQKLTGDKPENIEQAWADAEAASVGITKKNGGKKIELK